MNLFQAIDCLYTKKEIPEPPSDFMLHRFLASDPRLAPIAQDLNIKSRDRHRVWKIWKDALPKKKKAPFFKYPAPKKKASDELLERYCFVHKVNLSTAESEISIIELLGKLDELKQELGVE